jgi:hypothetical protein
MLIPRLSLLLLLLLNYSEFRASQELSIYTSTILAFIEKFPFRHVSIFTVKEGKGIFHCYIVSYLIKYVSKH